MKKNIVSIVMSFLLIMSFSTGVLAAPVASPADVDIDGQGYIADDTNVTNVMVDVSAPASFLWYADDSTLDLTTLGVYDIVSGLYPLTNNSQNVNLQVKVVGYALSSGAVNTSLTEADVTLNLVGDLAADGYGQDIFNGTPTWGVCTDLLASVNGAQAATPVGVSTWNIEFGGTYLQSSLPSAPELSDYTLELEFTAASIS